MIEAHQSKVKLNNSFQTAWEFLKRVGEMDLDTATGKAFKAKAGNTRDGRKVIKFIRGGIESARAYECCWGYYYNCNRTRFGMYAKALDDSI